ncbi:hypothetical protein H6G97_03015 [Nostoc flagelliforme FACHB-838]|uniref:Transposase n=1 Tax=Nostoc flagelliforme FACHB-838 TaxID=2692904 RepID=A0ABR8DJL3_9NOSO|nr:hypothetical protein [Nostoc flagelliforme FACHB-838]
MKTNKSKDSWRWVTLGEAALCLRFLTKATPIFIKTDYNKISGLLFRLFT